MQSRIVHSVLDNHPQDSLQVMAKPQPDMMVHQTTLAFSKDNLVGNKGSFTDDSAMGGRAAILAQQVK